jgi:hypothetical protein
MAMSKTFYWSVVEVVEATTMDFSCAIAGPAKKAPNTATKANMVFRSETKSAPLSSGTE